MKKLDKRQIDPSTLAVCGGVLSVVFALMPMPFPLLSFLLNYFAAVPLYFVGFMVSLPHLLLANLVSLSLFTAFAGILPALVFILSALIPVMLIIYRLKKGDTSGKVVSWITGYMLVNLIVILTVFTAKSINVTDFLQTWVTLISEKTALKSIDQGILSLIPGITAVSWIIMCLVNTALAQNLVKKFDPSFKSNPFFGRVSLPENWDIILAFSLLLILTQAPFFAFMGKNMALLCCVPIYLVGLKVTFGWLANLDNPHFWMTGLVFISFLLVWPGIFIVILGVLEPTLRFHSKRMIK